MRLTPHEQERLMVHVAARLAAERRGRGLRLNHPEAVALLSSFVLEGARDGRSVAELMDAGRHVLTSRDVMPGVAELVGAVQVEATFPDGTKLVTLHDPIAPDDEHHNHHDDDDDDGHHDEHHDDPGSAPGRVEVGDGTVVLNLGRAARSVVVENTGDRPVQVGSHYHFAEANPALSFDRSAAHGHRLDVPAGTAVRFEPGVTREVDLVPLVGKRAVWGLRGEVAGRLDVDDLEASDE